MKSIYNSSIENLANDFAQIFAAKITKIIQAKDHAVVALCGGKSIMHFYAKFHQMENVDWQKVHFFMVDDRLVPLDHPQSNFRQAMEQFGNVLKRKKYSSEDNFHPFIFNPQQDDLGISKYADEIAKYGGKFDIVLLGVGEDGHIAALYPSHHSILEDSDYFLIMHDSPKMPPGRMTASRKLIARSDIAFAFFIGEQKRDALVKFLDGTVSVSDCPAKIIGMVRKAFVVTDIEGVSEELKQIFK